MMNHTGSIVVGGTYGHGTQNYEADQLFISCGLIEFSWTPSHNPLRNLRFIIRMVTLAGAVIVAVFVVFVVVIANTATSDLAQRGITKRTSLGGGGRRNSGALGS